MSAIEDLLEYVFAQVDITVVPCTTEAAANALPSGDIDASLLHISTQVKALSQVLN